MEYNTMLEARGIKVEKLCYLFLIFMTGCLIGWFYEEIFYWFTEGMLRNRGILYGPWLPIYGIGALGIYGLKPLKKNPLLLFLLCICVAGIVEYIIGYAGIHLMGLRLWDYRGLFLNLSGIICFRSVVSFGFLGLAFHYLVEPAGEKLYQKIPVSVIRPVCIGVTAVFIADCILSALFRTPITY
ncbi:MAG: putative ABC transporter permease [Emergencia sp.]